MNIRVFLTAVFSVFCLSFYAQTNDNLRQALKGAIDNAKPSLEAASFGNSTVAVLPLKGRQGAEATDYLKTVLTQAGCKCVEDKNAAATDEILKEIAWNTRNDDILSPDTVIALGKLKGAQILVYGAVTEVSETPERVFAEISLHASDVATKQHLWGGVFASRFYLAADVKGIVSLDSKLRDIIKEGIEDAVSTMKAPEYATKLSAVKSATVIPLVGDMDQYMTGLLIGSLTSTSIAPVYPQIPSLSLIRSFARDGKLTTEAIVYGAVRDLSERKDGVEADATRMKKIERYTQRAEIQFFMEDVHTGHIIWSKTVSKESPKLVETTLDSTNPEDQKLLSDVLVTNSPSILRYIFWGIGGLVVLIIVLWFIRAVIVSGRLR